MSFFAVLRVANRGDSQSPFSKIIATKPKTGRRGGAPRRRATPTARTAVLGKPQPIVAQKVSAVAAGKAIDGVGAPSEKIVVSGLPLDVNEGQIKVSTRFALVAPGLGG